jgi:tripartite-type tricarboxylate transporter receptor subunit TctC
MCDPQSRVGVKWFSRPESRVPNSGRIVRPDGLTSKTRALALNKKRRASGGKEMKIVASLLLACAVPLMAAGGASAEDYPARPVTFVVPFAPGGATDILGRLVGQKLTDRFGKTFVVENRLGAGTATAATQVSKSAPDGYTIMMATSGTMVHNPIIQKKLSYDPAKDLKLAALICHVPFVLVVNNDLPVHSVADLLKLAKERKLSYGSGGVGAFHHLLGELFKSQFGLDMTHVPYRGTLPSLNDVIAGHIQLMFSDLAPAYPLIQAGKLRALGITTAQPAASAPELRPLAEVGVPGFDWAAWQTVAVPAATPKDVTEKLNVAINAAIADPDVTKQLGGMQFIPVGKGSPEELDKFTKSEAARWTKVLTQAGVAGIE